MKCFYHHDRDAVGTCKSCQRGLCPECAVEFPHGLACKARCEADAEGVIRLILNNVRLASTSAKFIRANRSGGIWAACFFLVSGAVFLIGGIHEELTMIALLGGCLVTYGIATLLRTLRLTSQIPKIDV